MRYIHKNIYSEAHKLLAEWVKIRRIANQSISYNEFDYKKKLNELLREEQGGICCYCQQRITKHGDKNAESHNEHLWPQKGAHARKDLQVDHGNIFASCNYSTGKGGNEHCGIAKHDDIIYDFIKWVDCSRHFKYNIQGEILPQGIYGSFQEFKDHESELDNKQKQALRAIEVLNLNHATLINERKKDVEALIKVILDKSQEEVKAKIIEFSRERPLQPFIDMLLYYMRKKQ